MKSFLESLVSDQTRRTYKNGLKKFEEYYGKSVELLLKEEDPGKIIEKCFVSLKKKYAQNSCKALVNPVMQYCKYNNIQPRVRKSLGMSRSTLTTRDHMLSVDEARSMFEIASLEEKIMVKTWLLGLRIGDAVRLEWNQFDIKPREGLVEILIDTKKEGIVAHVFIDPEFQKLLAKHIPNLNQKNPYLFQNSGDKHLSEKQLLRKLQSLQKKAHIKPKGRFGWHIARKLFLRTCAENAVISWNARLLVGKAVDKSIGAYINGVSLRKDACKVLKVLLMEPPKPNIVNSSIEEALDTVFKVLRSLCLKELQNKQQSSGYMGMLVDYSRLSDKEVLEEYLKQNKKK